MYHKVIEREKMLNTIISELHMKIDFKEGMINLLRRLKEITLCSSIGIRLEENGDYPYYVNDGFPDTFILKETSLCAKDEDGKRIRIKDSDDYLLECMCGNIIRGRYDPNLDIFTVGGSFYSNNTSELLLSATDKELQSNTRNYCNSCGYESVALIPIKIEDKNIGLIQLNDKRQGMFTADLINFLEIIGKMIGIIISNRLSLSKLELSEKARKESDDFNLQRQKIDGERIRLADERFYKAFNASPYMMAIIRMSDYKYMDVNRRFLMHTGFSYEYVIGKTALDIGVPKNEFLLAIQLIDKHGLVENMEVAIAMKDGFMGTSLLSAERIIIDNEECILMAYNDITELKRMNIEISRLDRLNLVGQMAAGIGHEIRNPMTTVRGYLQLLGAKPDYSSQKSTFNLMISELDRANSIITEFLELARTRPSKPENNNLNEILSKLYPLLEADAYTQNKHVLYIPMELPSFNFDENEISQLILNLAKNGLESMDDKGFLSISTYVDDNDVVLKFEDQGGGIPPENLEKLGTPFFTTKGNGTGLGLATSYKIADSHNAKLEVESCQAGTTFYVRFPITQEQ